MTLILAFDSTPVAIPGVTKLQAVIGYSAWVATALCLIGLIVTGALMAVAHHHGTNQHVGRLGMVAAGCLIVGAASPIAGSILGFNLFTSDPEAIPCLLYTSDAADDLLCVDLGGRRIIKKKNKPNKQQLTNPTTHI